MAIFEISATGAVQFSSDAYDAVFEAVSGVPVTVPGDAFLLQADFRPQGSDLVLICPDGTQILIEDYFLLDDPPDLVTDGGAVISGALAAQLAGASTSGQFALLQNGEIVEIAQASQSIGVVETSVGHVEAVRIDGTKVVLHEGDGIYQGDALITGVGAAIGITFVDDTTFSLGEEGRFVIDELVYDPDNQEGLFKANLVQGVFTFVSGQIAKTAPEAMTVNTPTATIGVRGTAFAGEVNENGETTATLMAEKGGFAGELIFSNSAGMQIINQPFQAITISSAFEAPSQPFQMSPQQVAQQFGSAIVNLPGASEHLPDAFREQVSEAVEEQQAAVQEENSTSKDTLGAVDDGGPETITRHVEVGGLEQVVEAGIENVFSMDGFGFYGAPSELLVSAHDSPLTLEFSESWGVLVLNVIGTGGFLIDASDANTPVVINVEAGAGEVVGGVGNDVIVFNDADNLVNGGAGAEWLDGKGGQDTIYGGLDNDYITGGLGADTLYGEEGADLFIYNAIAETVDTGDRDPDTPGTQLSYDIIGDFSIVESDVIQLNGFTTNPTQFSYIGANVFTNTGKVQARMAVDTALEIDADGDGVKDMDISMTGIVVGALCDNCFDVT